LRSWKKLNKKSKIAFIGNTPPPYHGVCIQNNLLLNSVLKDEFELIHIPSSPNKSLKEVGKVSLSNITGAFKSYLRFFKVLTKFKPEITYLTIAQNSIGFFRDGIYIILNYLFGKSKVVIHCRGSYYLEKYNSSSFVYKKFADFVYSKTSYCIVLGKNLIPMMKKWFSDDKIQVVPNGTGFKLVEFEKKYNNDKIIFGYLGMLSKEKGFYELLEILTNLMNKYSGSEAMIAGNFIDEGVENAFANFVSRNNFGGRVSYLGNVTGKDKEKFYSQIDLLIFPSWTEGHPNVILEAMASGIPIVASNVGAVPETVINGVNGFVLNAKDVRGFTEKADEIISKGLIENMGRNSVKLYEENYTEEIYINRMVDSFKKIIKSNETDR